MPLQKPFEPGDRVLVKVSEYGVKEAFVVEVGTSKMIVTSGIGDGTPVFLEDVIHAPSRPTLPPLVSWTPIHDITGMTPEQEERRYRARRDANLRGDSEAPRASVTFSGKQYEAFKIKATIAGEDVSRAMKTTEDHPLDTCQCGEYYKNHGGETDPPHAFVLMDKHAGPATAAAANHVPPKQFRLGDCVKQIHNGRKGFIELMTKDKYTIRYDDGGIVGYAGYWMRQEFVLDKDHTTPSKTTSLQVGDRVRYPKRISTPRTGTVDSVTENGTLFVRYDNEAVVGIFSDSDAQEKLELVRSGSTSTPLLQIGDFVEIPAGPVGSGTWEKREVSHVGRASFTIYGGLSRGRLAFANHGRTWRIPPMPAPPRPKKDDIVWIFTSDGWKPRHVFEVSELGFRTCNSWGLKYKRHRYEDYNKEELNFWKKAKP